MIKESIPSRFCVLCICLLKLHTSMWMRGSLEENRWLKGSYSPPAKPTPAQMMPPTICIPEDPCMACGKLDLLESLFSTVMITASWPWGYPSEFHKVWAVCFLGRISFVYFLNFHFLHSILKNDFTVKVVTLILFVTEQERHKSAELPNRLVRTTEKQSQFCLPSCHILSFWIGEN